MRKLLKNFQNSLNGLRASLKEHSFILEVIGGFLLIPYLIMSDINIYFKLIIGSIYFLLLAFELLNTSIEKLSDKISKEYDPDIKKIKDISSASVFIVLILLLTSLILILFLFIVIFL